MIRTVANRQTHVAAKSTLGTADLALEAGRWYRLRVRVEGRHLQAFIDDKPLLDVKTEAGTDTGQAFVGAYGAATEFPARSASIP